MSPYHKCHLNSSLPLAFTASHSLFFIVVRNISLCKALHLPYTHTAHRPRVISPPPYSLAVFLVCCCLLTNPADSHTAEQVILQTTICMSRILAVYSDTKRKWRIRWTLPFLHIPIPLYISYDDVMVWLITYLLLNWSTWHWLFYR